jgi:hypothetical protein
MAQKEKARQENWEKEFDKEFSEIHGRRLPDKIKSFISQLLNRELKAQTERADDHFASVLATIKEDVKKEIEE